MFGGSPDARGRRYEEDRVMRWSFVTPSRPSLQRARRAAVVVAMSAAAVATTTAVAPSPVAAAGVQLYASDNEYSTVINCTSIAMGTPLAEAGVGAYVGSYADPDAGLPAPNQTFYVEVYLAGLGDACGGHHVSVELMLPPGVSLNVTNSSPIECYIGGQTLIASECAQSMQASPFRPGALWYPSPDVGAARTWPLAQGGTWRFKFPVRSTIPQSTTVQAFLQVVDGWGNPTLRPTGPLAVFSNAGPSIVYATPSTKFTPVPNSVNFTTESTATVFKPTAQTGTIYFDIATNSNFSPVLFTDVGPVPAGLPAPEIYTDWVPPAGNTFSIQPNTTYYWRARYAPNGGSQITGATQRFTSPASGKKVVGNGTAASCTVAALAAAFTPYTERVDFECGPLPVTIQLPDGYYTEGPLTIDGKGKVTLVAAPNLPVFIHQGGNLQLIGLTLTGGRTAGCGGAVQIVEGNAELTNMRLLDSRAQWGGGLCVMSGSTANVYNSYISGNVASGGGGGIYAGGNVYLRQTEVTNNTANSDGGGGVYSDAEVFEADYSTFAFNTANGAAYGRGGGLLFESATVGDIGTSTISGNTAVKGGGVHNEGDSWFTGVTIANNTATGAGRGGGIESETTGFTANLRFRNSIIANNVNSSSGTPVAANCASNSLYRLHTSNGNNLVSDFSCNFNTFGDLQNSDPKLRPLAWNGGPTRTHALPVSSPAVDTADNTYCGFYDQRGVNDGGTAQDIVTRWIDSDGNGSAICDRGAYELAAEPVFLTDDARTADGHSPCHRHDQPDHWSQHEHGRHRGWAVAEPGSSRCGFDHTAPGHRPSGRARRCDRRVGQRDLGRGDRQRLGHPVPLRYAGASNVDAELRARRRRGERRRGPVGHRRSHLRLHEHRDERDHRHQRVHAGIVEVLGAPASAGRGHSTERQHRRQPGQGRRTIRRRHHANVPDLRARRRARRDGCRRAQRHRAVRSGRRLPHRLPLRDRACHLQPQRQGRYHRGERGVHRSQQHRHRVRAGQRCAERHHRRQRCRADGNHAGATDPAAAPRLPTERRATGRRRREHCAGCGLGDGGAGRRQRWGERRCDDGGAQRDGRARGREWLPHGLPM
jgi:hypothetical protein